MRGTFFVQQKEIVLEIEGESWEQGETVKVKGQIKSHQTPELEGPWSLALVLVDQRKLKKKDPKAFQVIEEEVWQEKLPSKDFSFEKEFSLEKDASISDGVWTLAIKVGPQEDPYQCGLLHLTITPWKIVTGVLQTFENFHRFKMKSLKNKKATLEAKMVPPGSKEFGGVDSLNLVFKRKDKNLALDFQFIVKKLAHGPAGIETVKEKLNIKKELTPKEYQTFGDSLHQEKINEILRETLDQVRTKTTF